MNDDFKKIISILGEAARALKQTGVNVSLAADMEKLTMACEAVAMTEDNSQPVAEVRLVDDFCGCCQHPDVEWLGQAGNQFPIGTKFYSLPPVPAVVEPIYLRQFGEGLSVGWEVVNKMRYDNAAPGMRRVAYSSPGVPREIMNCLAFFASVIKSGEPWTETCQRDYDAARHAAMLAQPDGWVACSERMPEPNTFVQVSNGVWVGIGMYNDADHCEDDERWQDEHHGFIDLLHHPVTHWMPLPAVPSVVGQTE